MDLRTRRLLILFSDTGGGHRSAAHAVAHALRDLYDGQAQIELVDALSDYAPWPFNHLGRMYPYMVRLKGWPWAAGYHLSDGPRRVALLIAACWPWVQAAMRRLLRDHPADVVVSCHPLLNHVTQRTLAQTETPTTPITLVTDLATAHALWFAPESTRCLVPTGASRQCALVSGLPAERVLVTGLPVHPRFVTTARENRLAVRRRLGLEPDLPTVLLVSGAEGMGPVIRTSRAVAASGIQAQLVIVAGRNERLRAGLSAETWPLPVRVEGFVDNMHEWMRAVDLLVTKAGPSTVSEALVMGLPLVLSGALPGQERPTVDYVVRAGAGVWAPSPGRVARAVRELVIPGNPELAQMSLRARALARPDAARRVAEVVWAAAGG
ncbi:MAG: glycosyltransferase [Chloroflexota bacterium]|nr:glycosyltransferase [Chloroflexota bacterium]